MSDLTGILLVFGITVLLLGALKLPDLFKGIIKGIQDFKSDMKRDGKIQQLTPSEKLKLADDYCYHNKQKEAKQLLKEVIEEGTKEEAIEALQYAKNYCENMFKTLLDLAVAISRIKLGIDII